MIDWALASKNDYQINYFRMEFQTLYKDLGIIKYKKAWDYQKNLVGHIFETNKINSGLPFCEQNSNYNFLLFCEHPHVYTLGKHGSESNLLIPDKLLKKKGIEFFKSDRGGDITYHGPGQIVGYPIFDLEALGIRTKEYIFKMENAIIGVLEDYSLKAERLEGATGVWIDAHIPGKARKICAMGVKITKGVTMHGFALNVNTDLTYYQYINPCGFTDKGVTSLEKELGQKVDIEEVKEKLKKSFCDVYNINISQEFIGPIQDI
jgi:lipoyl(octanoyl) transferase